MPNLCFPDIWTQQGANYFETMWSSSNCIANRSVCFLMIQICSLCIENTEISVYVQETCQKRKMHCNGPSSRSVFFFSRLLNFASVACLMLHKNLILCCALVFSAVQLLIILYLIGSAHRYVWSVSSTCVRLFYWPRAKYFMFLTCQTGMDLRCWQTGISGP